jgi:aminomethyltransferase
MALTLARTPLSDWHASHGGRMVDFAGWLMPVQYGSIVAEHQATRTAVGLFDVSHMGRVLFGGAAVEAFLDGLVTRRVRGMKPGAIRYALVTNERGGILDDVLVYHLSEPDGDFTHGLVVNASNREKILNWIARQPLPGNLHYDDRTEQTTMIAVQGPRAGELLTPLFGGELLAMKYYTSVFRTLQGEQVLVSRTGYTGEDGWELIAPADTAVNLWEHLVAHSSPFGGSPAGLGCRDTLRLEAAMPLYGHELTEEINPLEAGLGFAVDLDGHDFPGASALREEKARGPTRTRVGIELSGRRPARECCAVNIAGATIGSITSGTFSPTLDRPIAMALVESGKSSLGTAVEIDIRGRLEPATIVKLPFYRRSN